MQSLFSVAGILCGGYDEMGYYPDSVRLEGPPQLHIPINRNPATGFDTCDGESQGLRRGLWFYNPEFSVFLKANLFYLALTLTANTPPVPSAAESAAHLSTKVCELLRS